MRRYFLCGVSLKIIPDFPLGLEVATPHSLMDFCADFMGNSRSIDRKYAQKRRKMSKLTFK
jgi:hypothetical protein